MNKYQKFIEFCAALPCAKKESYRTSEKAKYQTTSRLSFSLIREHNNNFIFFTAKAIILRVYQSDKNKYSDFIKETLFRRWDVDEDTSNWYEIPEYKINDSNENIIFDLIKKSYDNIYHRCNDNCSLDFFRQIFEGNLKKEHIMEWAIKYKKAEKYQSIFESIKKKSIMLVENSKRKAKKGDSKMGGQPDLPVDFQWPVCDGKPLTFMAQINLSEIKPELAGYQLPPQGFLYFFSAVAHIDYDKYTNFIDMIDEEDTNRVYYFDKNINELKRKNNYYSKLHEVAIDIDYADSYPLYTDEPVFEDMDLSEEELELITDVADLQHMGTYAHITLNYQNMHSLLAYEIPVQERVSDNIVLLQTTTSDKTGMDWGDSGTFFFHINSEDLIKQDFSNITCSNQCS